MELCAYVPTEDAGLDLPRGCAILGGRPSGSQMPVAVSAPNDRMARSNNYADLCRAAYRRYASRQTRIVPVSALVPVAIWNEQRGEVRLLRGRVQPLERHLGRRVYRNELESADGIDARRSQGRRDARKALMMGRPDRAAQIMRDNGLHGF